MLAAVPHDRACVRLPALADGRLDAPSALRALLGAEPNLPAAHLMADVLARRGELAAAEALLIHCLAARRLHLARQSLRPVLIAPAAAGLAELDRLLAHEPRNTRGRAVKAAALTEPATTPPPPTSQPRCWRTSPTSRRAGCVRQRSAHARPHRRGDRRLARASRSTQPAATPGGAWPT